LSNDEAARGEGLDIAMALEAIRPGGTRRRVSVKARTPDVSPG